ncbi:MAG: hypothetical protein JWQ90_869 [Hydrocarboniphaga sp.]|uniref:PaaI family thioesterase n=1 Tax=Hydrocarboniphaga sp. TaxID=2033016 RepID=UPI00261060E6|nr:PaaI family thioesterase [Hydrocarboniphaga sp.]MDB5968419.1 hypothetical protein [Hydrocarboniphaga sp.]
MNEIPAGFAPLQNHNAHSFIAHIGPFYERRENDSPCVGVRIAAQHCNPFGEVHGGFVAAMFDFVGAYTMLRGPDPTPSVVTVQQTTQLIAGARLGNWIEGRATIHRKGRTIAHVGCDLKTGGQLIAHAEFVFRVLSGEGTAARIARRAALNPGATGDAA